MLFRSNYRMQRFKILQRLHQVLQLVKSILTQQTTYLRHGTVLLGLFPAKVYKVFRVLMAHKEPQERKVKLVHKEPLVLLVLMVHKARLVLKVFRVKQEPKVQQVHRVYKEKLEHKAYKVSRAHKAYKETKALLDFRV